MNDELIIVGEYIEKFNNLTGQNLPCSSIFQSTGLIKHISKHHPGKENLINNIPEIISNPDFIGKHPKEVNSIELVKKYSDNIMVCIKLDKKDNYLFVASIFEITESKLNNRINSGRLKKY